MDKAVILALVLFPLAAGPGLWTLGRRRSWYLSGGLIACALVELLLTGLCCLWPSAQVALPRICALGLSFQSDGLALILCPLTAFAFLMAALAHRAYFAGAERTDRYVLFLLLTQGALMGVFLSGDLLTTYLFFELLSLSSYVWVAQNETQEALFAGDTYLAIAIIGGLTLLMGLFLLYALTGTLDFDQMELALAAVDNRAALTAAGVCMLVGFGAKAGLYPLHIWLPRAHPAAPAPASALLSGLLTKSGVYGVLVISVRLFSGVVSWGVLLLVLGTITMVLGAVLALFSLDIKRTLACSSLSQIGFITLGAAALTLLGHGHGALAAAGTVLHMVNHALFKVTLFLCAGVLYTQRHTLDLNQLRGAGRGQPLLMLCFLLGAAGISGVPGLSGYVSKTLLHESLLEAAAASTGTVRTLLEVSEGLFLFSGGLTLAYMLKLFLALFVQKGEKIGQKPRLTAGTALSIALPAALLPVLGLTPGRTMDAIAAVAAPFLETGAPHAVHYFAWHNLQGALISLAIGAAVYLLIVLPLLSRREEGGRRYLNRWPRRLDLEVAVYRPALEGIRFVLTLVLRTVASLTDWLVRLMNFAIFSRGRQPFCPPRDDHFGRYDRTRALAFRDTFSYQLLLYALGISAGLIYLVVR